MILPSSILNYIIYGVIVWNGIVFALFGIDKRKAIKNKWRISETTFIVAAFFMGGLGALAGMNVFRHKTKHLKFKILVPLALLCNIAVAVLLIYFLNWYT